MAQACILVVDDDEAIRKMIRATLTRAGYEVREARNGREALETMRSGDNDLVVLDLMMPEVTGWDVLNVRAEDEMLRKIPVIVVSANRGPEIAGAVSAGICALLPKPFDLDAFRALVASCLTHSHDGETPSS
jgi:CheY-like chemotaxis protein